MSRLLLQILALTLVLGLIGKASGATKREGNPEIPFKNAMEALEAQNFTESLSWLGFVKRDFPGTDKSSQATALSCTILLSRELASLRVINLYSESKELLIDKNEKEREKHYQDIFEAFSKRASHSSFMLASEAKNLLEMDKENSAGEFSVNFKIETDGWNVSALKNSVQKGKILDPKDMDKLFKGELLTNFLGFLTEVMLPTPEDALEGNFKGTLSKDKFYRAIGERLLINAKRDPSEDEFSLVARQCFEQVLYLTEKDPYSKERRLATRGINELKVIKDSRAEIKKCPKCGKPVEPGWKFCPFDGTDLKKAKK